jgi:hypothetical protein
VAGSSETLTVTGLSPDTTYYFAMKTADEVPNWSGLSNVANKETATADTMPPTVTTGDASNISTTPVRLNGDLISPGTAGTVTVSFVWGTSSGLYPNETTGQTMTSTGSFYFDLGSLAPGTTYYYRTKAVGHGDPVYGAEKSFTTGQGPKVQDLDPDSGKRKQHLTVIIPGSNFDGATFVDFGSGIAVEGFNVNSSTEIMVQIAIDADATKGARDVSVTTGWGTATKTDGFTVVGGGGGICSGGASAMPDQGSEMTTTLAALGLLFGMGYLLVRKGTKNRRDSVRA